MRCILLWVVDAQLLQEEAVIQKATAYFGQELKNDASLRAQENNGVVAIGPSGIVHCNASETISGVVKKRESEREENV